MSDGRRVYVVVPEGDSDTARVLLLDGVVVSKSDADSDADVVLPEVDTDADGRNRLAVTVAETLLERL